MTNPAAVESSLASAILSQARHLFTARRAGPFSVQPGEPIKAAVEPGGLFADPLQFLLQSLDISGVLRDIAPGTSTGPTSSVPRPLDAAPISTSPAAVPGPLNAALDAVADMRKVQPRLRVAVQWRIERISNRGAKREVVEEWSSDLDDPGALANPEIAVRLAPTRAFPLRVADPTEDLPLGDVVCLHARVTLTLGEDRLRVGLPGILVHVLPVFLPSVLVMTTKRYFQIGSDPMVVAVPADSPINTLEALQETLRALRDQLRPRGMNRFALWAAGLGFLTKLLDVPNPITFVKGNRIDKVDEIDDVDDQAVTVSLFGAPGAVVTLSCRPRLRANGALFKADNASDPGLLHLRVGRFGYIACQDINPTGQGGDHHEKQAPRGELLPPEAELVNPSGPDEKASVSPPSPDSINLLSPGRVTVVQSPAASGGFSDRISAWTFEDLDPTTGQPWQPAPAEPESVGSLARYRCRDGSPQWERFDFGFWKEVNVSG